MGMKIICTYCISCNMSRKSSRRGVQQVIWDAASLVTCIPYLKHSHHTASPNIIPIYTLGLTGFYYITFSIETLIHIKIFACCCYKRYLASQWGQLKISYGSRHLMFCYEYGPNINNIKYPIKMGYIKFCRFKDKTICIYIYIYGQFFCDGHDKW